MARKAFRGLFGFVMILALSGCDNAEWGGVRIELLPPPPPSGVEESEESVPTTSEAAPDPEIALATGPVLYMGTRSGSRVSVHPVGRIGRDTLLPFQPTGSIPGFREAFIQRELSPGTALTLFAEGVRVGTLRVDSVRIGEGWCEPRPVASGVAELIPEAASATRFLALAGESSPASTDYRPFRPEEHDYDRRVAGLELAGQALSRTGAPWPPSVLETRVDMQAFPLDGVPGSAIAATFLFEDRLAVGPPASPSAWSLSILGELRDGRWELGQLLYHPVTEGGKAAARFFEQLDWDGDGEDELLFEVFGEEIRWEVALDRGPEGWETLHASRCAG